MFGGVMFLLCAGLTVMQYRWTGEIANAELIRLHANLDYQSHALARGFDTELSDICEQIVPFHSDPSSQIREEAFVSRFKTWKSTNPRPIFSRVALAAPDRGR